MRFGAQMIATRGQPRALAHLGSQRPSGVVVPVAGAAATTLAIAPTAKFHINTATLTMQAVSSLTVNVSGVTVTLATNAGPSIFVGDNVTINGTVCKILKAGTGTTTVWAQQTGTFTIDTNLGTLTGVTMLYDSKAVTAVADQSGNGYDLSSADGNAPRLRTDAAGRKYLLFVTPTPTSFNGQWMRNLSIAGLDTYNTTAIFVGRVLDAPRTSSQLAIFGLGSKENATGTALAALAYRAALPLLPGVTAMFPTPPANINKFYLGAQLQVFSTSIATDDYGSGSTNTNVAMMMLNEQSATLTSTFGRNKPASGMELGKLSNQSTGGTSSGYGIFALYELTLYLHGEMGTRAQMPARYAAAHSAHVTNWAIPAITDRVILLGDSRGHDGLTNVTAFATAPGDSRALPASWSVVNMAVSGQGIGQMWDYVSADAANASNIASPLVASMMLGGGHDYVAIAPSGVNDLGGQWPPVNNAFGTVGAANEMYNGADISTGLTLPAISAGTRTLTNSVSITLYNGMQVQATGVDAGVTVDTTATGTSFHLNITQTGAVSAATGTAVMQSYQKLVQLLLTRGFNVRWAVEMVNTKPESAGAIQLHTQIASNAITDATAAVGSTLGAKLKVWDIRQVTIGGAYPFGADYATTRQTDPYYIDNTHQNPDGMALWAYGGDAASQGLVYQLTH